MTSRTLHDRFRLLAPLVALALLIPAGCTQKATSANGEPELDDRDDSENIDALVDALEDESETVRSEAQRSLEKILKRKIYFDPAASAEDRARALEGVREMWQNLQDRDIVEAAKERVPLQYYYDLNTGEVFEDVASSGPIETPSGPHQGMPAGVRAVMFACHDCGDATDRYVGWLEVRVRELRKYGVEFKSDDGLKDLELRRAFRKPDGGPWAVFGTAEAEAISAEGRRCENREIPLICRPGR